MKSERILRMIPSATMEINKRISYSNSMENLQKSMDRIEVALSKLV